MAQAHFEVVRIMRRRDLHRARSKLLIHIVIGNHRNLPAYQGQYEHLAHAVLIPRILRIHSHGRIAQERLRTRRGDLHVSAAVFIGVSDMPEESILLLVLHLRIGDRRLTLGTPVDDLGTLIDPSLLIQIDKDLFYRMRKPLVHRKPRTAPIAGSPQFLELFDNPILILFFPGPGPLHEGIAADLFLGQPFLCQLLHQFDLRRNAGMIRSRLP